MFSVRSGTYLAAAGLCLFLSQGVFATTISSTVDFSGDSVTTGWSLNTANTSGVSNERLEARPINGSAAVAYVLPESMTSFTATYRGQFEYSYWGTYTEMNFFDNDDGTSQSFTLGHGVNAYHYGSNNYAILAGSVVLMPLEFSIYEYSLTVMDGSINYSAVNTSTGLEAFNLTHTDGAIVASNFDQISFRSHNTTGSNVVWLDDINLQMTIAEVPTPAPLSLLLAGLLGAGLSRRRMRPSA